MKKNNEHLIILSLFFIFYLLLFFYLLFVSLLSREFNGVGFKTVKESVDHVLQSEEYSQYLHEQFDQLINDYKPAYFWGDWGAPRSFNVSALIEKMDAAVGSKAMINDRFNQEAIHSFFNLFPSHIAAPLRDVTAERFNILSW